MLGTIVLALAVGLAPSLVKVRPDEPLPATVRPAGTLSLVAARGECEAAHLVVSAGDEPAPRIEAVATPLASTDATLAIALYREAFLDVRTPSNTEGATGRWPDALVPDVDQTAREKRNAFPFDLPARRHQPLLVEVCVPAEAAPGRYEGSIALSEAGRARARVSVVVDVRDVTLPATSSFPLTIGLSAKSLALGHTGERGGEELRRTLVRRYADAALRHRASLHTMTMEPPIATLEGKDVRVDFTQWDSEIAPLLDGEGTPGGARFSAIDLRTPPNVDAAALPAYARAVAAHFRERGWLNRLFAYVMDEPRPEQHAELRARLEALAGAGIRRLVTMPHARPFEGLVDVWAPNVNCLDFKRTPDEFCAGAAPRSAYRARERRGDALWWYVSCSSHGCGSGPFGRADLDTYFTGWPSYVVDVDGAAARVTGWLGFVNDVAGELYFDGAYAWRNHAKTASPQGDPWDDQWAFGGNGDGTLFYPGRPDRIGGTTHVPVASLRLALIRDGLEDRELLALLERQGRAGRRLARELATEIAPRPFRFARDPGAYERAHRRLLDALAPAAGAAARE